MDIPLDDAGLEQAKKLGGAFAAIPVSRVLCSDLTRCRQTAEPILAATGRAAEYRADLRERSFGEWEGAEFSTLAARAIEYSLRHGVDAQDVRPPNGESFRDVWNRLLPVSEALFEAEEDAVVVTHGGAASVLLAQMLRGTLETHRGFRFSNASVTELERRPEGLFLMTRYNDVSHLAARMEEHVATA